eukprot:TRINITY_DN14042_c0_g1_i1.p1 TRINITY_DN14042_c0_g1~~TRINITY_DN14042_c0_g1_i1.p1  ORF type:complete len:86 (-),score=7.19 TRINITY_DN14042_c0_g1_i1:176-433(-)
MCSCVGAFFEKLSQNARNLFNATITRLQFGGFTVQVTDTILQDVDEITEVVRGISSVEHVAYHPWYETYRDIYRDQTREKLDGGF